MEFCIGVITNKKNILIKSLKRTEVISREYPLEDIISENYEDTVYGEFDRDLLLGVFYDGELPSEAKKLARVLQPLELLSWNSDDSDQELIKKVSSFYEHHSLKNIIQNQENIFKITEDLKKSYKEDRQLFFKNLWALLIESFSPTAMSIYYNDLNIEKENSLSLSKIHGINTAITRPSTGEENLMFDAIKNNISPSPSIISHDFEKKEVTLGTQIQGTSVLILLKTLNDFSILQKSFFKVLINGINYQLTTNSSK